MGWLWHLDLDLDLDQRCQVRLCVVRVTAACL